MTGEEFLRGIDERVYGGDGTVARLQIPCRPCDCDYPECEGWILGEWPGNATVRLPIPDEVVG